MIKLVIVNALFLFKTKEFITKCLLIFIGQCKIIGENKISAIF